MPTPRNCRNCGATLSADVRWCGQCSQRVTEFAARPSTDHGFVGPLRDDSPDRGHYSRWEKSATTFGPAGRIMGTGAVVLFIAWSFLFVFFIYWIIFAIVGGWVIRQLWKPGWVASSSAPRALTTDDPPPAIEPIAEGFRVPRPEEPLAPSPPAPLTRGEIAGRIVVVIVALALMAIFTWGSQELRVAAICLATMLGMYTFFRSFLTS